MQEEAISRMLDPKGMHPLRVEKSTVAARDVFHDPLVWQSLRDHSQKLRTLEQQSRLPASIEEINRMTVSDGYVPEEVSHQDADGYQILRQVQLIKNAPFFKAIGSHSEFRILPGFEKQQQLMADSGNALNLLRRVGNLFRQKKIHVMQGTPDEIKITQLCYGTLWPAGINLYAILRELYPIFHARLTGQIPAWVAQNLDTLLDRKIESHNIRGVGRFGVDDNGRFLGAFPVAEVPEDQVTLDCLFVSQDQLGRRAIAGRILNDAVEIVTHSREQKIVVVDYAGGVGNMSEMLLKRIYAMPREDLKHLLLDRLRVVVIDIAEDQLAAGRNRFEHMARHPELKGINDKIIFLQGDITRKRSTSELNSIKAAFGPEFLNESVYLGMTSYTIGALDNLARDDGTSYSQAMADEMFQQCWKTYAVDFSAPMWRMAGFLKDTGAWGHEYLRTLHGVTEPQDEKAPINKLMAIWLRLRYGLKIKTVAQLVRFVASGPGLASHYDTVWPDSDGHNSGYTVLEDGTLKKPGVLSFAERLQGYGARVYYKSKVWLFATNDLGATSAGMRAWVFMPGWVADFVVAENEKLRPR